jgi:competence protein ComEA
MIKKLLATLLALFAAAAFAAVDANKATQAELESVKGIGPAISAKIVDERKKAPFKDWNDMVERVKGVGDGNAAKFSTEGLTVNGAAFKGAAPMAAKKDDKPAAAPKAEEKKAAAPAAAAAPMAKADDKKADKPAAAMSADDKKAVAKKEMPLARRWPRTRMPPRSRWPPKPRKPSPRSKPRVLPTGIERLAPAGRFSFGSPIRTRSAQTRSAPAPSAPAACVPSRKNPPRHRGG